jgi:TRAP transporter TAXI family solute receptor
VNGTYYPVGELIARVISSPPGARPCGGTGVCGVPNLIVVVQTSKGSVENVAAVQEGRVESGFAQSDIAFGAYTGSGVFAGQPPMTALRALASLYLESVHLVARSGTGIRSVGDLRGRRVAVDVEGSGTLVEARLILGAFGLSESSVEAVREPVGRSLDLMAAGKLDALFLVAGYPATAVSELAANNGAVLVPIEGPEVERLLREQRFFTPDAIPAATYPGQAEAVPTVAVAALWLVAATLPDPLVYEIATALWQPAAREALTTGHPKGEAIRLEHALQGVAIPVHPGAARYYREHGVAD